MPNSLPDQMPAPMRVDFSNWRHVMGRNRRLVCDVGNAPWSDCQNAQVVFGARYARKAARASLIYTSQVQVVSTQAMPLIVAKMLQFEGLECISHEALEVGAMQPIDLPTQLELAVVADPSIGRAEDQSQILIVAADGHYPIGSAGVLEAAFIKEGLSFLAAAHQARGLIVDLRKLDYVWGDEFDVTVPDRLIHWQRQIALITEAQASSGAFTYALGPDGATTDLQQALERCRGAGSAAHALG